MCVHACEYQENPFFLPDRQIAPWVHLCHTTHTLMRLPSNHVTRPRAGIWSGFTHSFQTKVRHNTIHKAREEEEEEEKEKGRYCLSLYYDACAWHHLQFMCDCFFVSDTPAIPMLLSCIQKRSQQQCTVVYCYLYWLNIDPHQTSIELPR